MPQSLQRRDIRDRIDTLIWECICDCFVLDAPFSLEEAVEKCREHIQSIGMLPMDYAIGRVLGALKRIEEESEDIKQLPSPGDYVWILPARG